MELTEIREMAGFSKPIWTTEDYLKSKEEKEREDGTE